MSAISPSGGSAETPGICIGPECCQSPTIDLQTALTRGGILAKQPSGDQSIEINAIIEKLYEVALDPGHYESLLDTWEAELAPVRTSPKARAAASQLEAHVERASVFLNRYADTSPEPIDVVLNQHIPFSAVAIDENFSVVASNFDLCGVGANAAKQLSDIPFLTADDVEDVRQLAHAVFESGEEVIHALSTGGAASRIALVKLRPAFFEAATGAVVAIFSHIQWSAQVEASLSRCFDLSKTETEIVRLMLEMKSRSEIARARDRSTETIKRHISSILRKTGCRSSSELLLIVMSFVNLISDEASDLPADAVGLRAVELPGPNAAPPRQLHYLEAGAWDGRPCIYLPGPYCLSEWPKSAEKAAKSRGIRTVTLIRRGYGPTAHAETTGDLASDVASEVLAVMDALGIDRAPILTQSNDIVFAVRLARKHPERVSAIIACGGAPPFDRPEQFDRMDKWHRFVLANAKFAPRLLPFIVKAGFFLAHRIGKLRFLEQVYGNVPGDMAVLANPEARTAILNGSRFALSDGVSAHAAFSELILYFGRPEWSADVRFAEGRVPIYLVNGSKDPMVRPEALDEIALVYPWIDITVYDGAGEFVFFQYWPDVLDVVERHLC